jgi:hypothetical protein
VLSSVDRGDDAMSEIPRSHEYSLLSHRPDRFESSTRYNLERKRFVLFGYSLLHHHKTKYLIRSPAMSMKRQKSGGVKPVAAMPQDPKFYVSTRRLVLQRRLS